LGSEESVKSFHYLENFRVDNLVNSTHHKINFKLSQPYILRFVAVVHSHLEFDLELIQLVEGEDARSLVKSSARGYEDALFV